MEIFNFQFSIFKNINKLICLSIILLSIFFSVPVLAQTKTTTDSATTAQEEKDIQMLKDKIATKVAELRQKNGKAVSGSVFEVNRTNKTTKLKIKTWKSEEYEISVDNELTKFYQISGEVKKEIKSDLIKKNSYIIATGIIKDKAVDANFIYLDEEFIVGSGKVSEVNKTDFYLKVVTVEKENLTLDIETSSRQLILNIKTLTVENIGFSKIKEGDTIHFVVKKTGTEEELNRYSVRRILIIPQEYFIK